MICLIHLQAQIYYPLADLSTIARFFDALAVELRTRMAAAGVTGGVKALYLLSRLLFASPGAEGTPLRQCGFFYASPLSLMPPDLCMQDKLAINTSCVDPRESLREQGVSLLSSF